MYELEKTFAFEAGHELKHHDGKCRMPHGHSYVLTVRLRADTLVSNGPKKNMVIDFSDISSIVKPMIVDFFDHKWMNETLCTDSPTVEFMAKWIFEYLDQKVPFLHAISLQETNTSSVTYYRPS